MPGSHLVVEDPRDLDPEEVLIAPVDAALLEAGGLAEKAESSATTSWMTSRVTSMGSSFREWVKSSEIGGGLERCDVEDSALYMSGDNLLVSCAVDLRENAERLNSGCGLSRDPALALLTGGGGKNVDDEAAGGDLCSTAGEARFGGVASSGEAVEFRLLGGEYGGGAGTTDHLLAF
jgi:hypothetical protein